MQPTHFSIIVSTTTWPSLALPPKQATGKSFACAVVYNCFDVIDFLVIERDKQEMFIAGNRGKVPFGI